MKTTPQDFTEIERTLSALLVAAVTATPFGQYYPDSDVVIRWRNGLVLPEVEIKLKRRVSRGMPTTKR